MANIAERSGNSNAIAADTSAANREKTRKYCNTVSAVKQFPSIFTGTEKVRLQKASNWWKNREEKMSLKLSKRSHGHFTALCRNGKCCASFKALLGRRRRPSICVSGLYNELF